MDRFTFFTPEVRTPPRKSKRERGERQTRQRLSFSRSARPDDLGRVLVKPGRDVNRRQCQKATDKKIEIRNTTEKQEKRALLMPKPANEKIQYSLEMEK